MANVLKITMIDAIHSLRSARLSCREIARRLGVHRETVSRHLRLCREPVSIPARAAVFNRRQHPAGSEGGAAGFNAPSGPASPWLAWLLEQRERGLSAKRIHQDLSVEHPAAAAVSYGSVRRLLKKHGAATPVPFRRMESPPGFEAQVDFGTGAAVIGPDGRRRKTHVIRVVLSHSRRGYSEAVFTQSTDDFIQCLENAFEHFGGVPRTTVLPTKPRTPRHKGKVERGVDYVQENALKGRTFLSLAAQNQHLQEWESRTADTRIHGTTKKQVLASFNEAERTALLALPPNRFEYFRDAKRKVSRDGHVEVAKAFYSVPPEYLGREVWVRWNGRSVWVFNDRMQQIAIHAKRDHGRYSTDAQHLDPTKAIGWCRASCRSPGSTPARSSNETAK